MKYLKLFEGEVFDKLNRLSKEYAQNEGRFMIFEHVSFDGNFFIGKLIKVVLNTYFINIEYYEWEDHYQAWETYKADAQHISDIKILKFFDTMAEAVKEYDFFNDTNKYNL